MGRFTGILALLLVSFLAVRSTAFASQIDGMTLTVGRDAAGNVTLDWTGGQPTFSVYRSATRQAVVAPGNLIGTTDVRTFDDTPPAGAIFYYEIASPCVYNPPEVCNGLDDDCNGTVDGPGSETSCSLPHAVATCAGGACAVVACDVGWGDCNVGNADGCEAALDLAQSTSPAAIWANDPNPNKDLRPGYQRVTGITNCGACGATCDDGSACTTDLCVPMSAGGGMTGECRHYDRGQCSAARCGGLTLPPGTPPPGDAACTAPDSDGDGLSDTWETAGTDPYTGTPRLPGIDLDCDGEISDRDLDMLYSDPPAGPHVKDLYLSIAYMGPSSTPGQEETESHAPPPEAVASVVAAFADKGITVHIDPVMPEVPHSSVVYMPVSGPDSCATGDAVNFYTIKNASFDKRKKFTHRFVFFGHNVCTAHGTEGNQNSGMAEIHGNDSIVSLGDFTILGTPEEVVEKKIREQAGTLMHELGHILGLDHGGLAGPCYPVPCASAPYNQKPNHISVMNYSYQLSLIPRAATPGTTLPLDPTVPWRPDFSSGQENDLDESNLNEISGLTGATPPYDRDIARYYCLGQGPYLAARQGPIDWNCDEVYSPSVVGDIDFDGTIATLPGANDWGNLDFGFQCNPTFLDESDNPGYLTTAELSVTRANARGLRAVIFCEVNADCDDGAFCNGAETCSPATGLCQPGTPLICDDLNPCTQDTCSAAGNACLYDPAPLNGTACAGPEFCVVATTCTNGVCGGGTPRDCEDGLACTADACNEALNACTSSCTATPCWTASVGSGIASTPANDTEYVPPGAPTRTYFAKGSVLYAFRNTGDAGGPAGSVKWTWTTPTGSTLTNFPAPVPLGPTGSGPMFIFLGGDDGTLYKVNADNGTTAAVADTKRTSCGTDQLAATPAVQLYRFSNPAFKSEMDSHAGHSGDDLVFVITRNQCGDTTRNRIIAYYASNLERKWVFNEPATHKMDYASEGCALDYTSNALFCGTSQPAGGTQNTLWAIDSISSQVVWSANAGSIANRPMLNYGSGRLYVAAYDGTVMAYDPAGSATGGAVRLWTSPALVPAAITRTPWIEYRPGGYQGSILVVDTAGRLTRFTDADDHATKNWSLTPGSGLTFTSLTAVDPVRGHAFIGRNDGVVQQVNLSTGGPEGTLTVGPSTDVHGVSLDVAGGAPGFNRLTAVGGNLAGTVAQFCTWPPPSTGCLSDADCSGQNGPCFTGTCDLPAGVCVRVPAPDGTACDDGLSCTSSSVCKSGACQSDSFTNCPCVSPGDRACGPALTCCGGTSGCKNLMTDPANCGSCGNACPSDRTCSGGFCLAAEAACTAPTDATLNGVASLLVGADAVAFDGVNILGPPACSLYVSSYGYPSPSTIKRVDAAGGITPITSPSPDSAPLNGIAVPREGNQFFAAAVNRPLGSVPLTTPALIEGGFTPAHAAVATTTTATFSTVPFAATMFDQGPVGPALDYQTYSSSSGGDSRVYLGNWAANGNVVELRRPCPSCSWAQTTVPVAITPAGDRITAIAFALEKNPGPPQGHRNLYVGHGTILSIFDLDLGTQRNVDLAAGQPAPAVNGILSIAVHPAYGEIYVEVKTTAGTKYLLNVDAHDMSTRHAIEVQEDLHLQPPVPLTFAADGRVVIMPDGQLLRFVPGVPTTTPPTFKRYVVFR